MIQVIPVILSGGFGTRLWPLSRKGFPKQFLTLIGDESLFQQAAKRLVCVGTSDIFVAQPLIVAGEDHRFLVTEQMREIGIEIGQVLLEPLGRNTAPALTLAALAATSDGRDAVLVVTPADQLITNTVAFTQAVQAAIQEAENDFIITLGVTPDLPHIGYGYIQIDKDTASRARIVKRFVEKPDLQTAKQYLSEGDYCWNAGIFVLKASVWLQALEMFRPDIFDKSIQAWEKRTIDVNPAIPFVRPGRSEFIDIPSESIDCAVMENCPSSSFQIKVVQLDAGWSDLGAWDSVWRALPKDDHGNAHVGDVIASYSQNNLVHASSRLVSLMGVSNLIVVESPDAVLVADRNHSQDIKRVVNERVFNHCEEHALHQKVQRPWGWYKSIDQGQRFKVKRIQVKPGASISLQKHAHRAEHWIVVKGCAEITSGNKVFTLIENQSTYIPLGEVHRLSNPGSVELEIIEVQSGNYLGEDDIIRIETR